MKNVDNSPRFGFRHIQEWYGRFERPISSLSLVGGFVFDALTLKRIDMLWDNIWLVGHVLIVALCMVWINYNENKPGDEKNPHTLHFWLLNILQFFFGGLLSTLLVFYFRSATLSVSWPFILILGAAFIANESLKHHFSRLTFQVSLFFLSLFLCAIFLVPVVVHRIGPFVFLLSGLVSLFLISFFLWILLSVSREKFHKSKRMIFLAIVSIFTIFNILYFTDIIPPIPLSLKDAGVYHGISRDQAGNFITTYEETDWRTHFFSYFHLYNDVHIVSGDTLYVYSAIFSPSFLNVTIVHEWQYLDPASGAWKTVSTVSLPVIGGRDGGFRTYSLEENPRAGKWRVNVETLQGQVIGRVRFIVVPVANEPVLAEKVNR